LRLVTENAAAALGIPDVGRLVSGAWGDLTALALPDLGAADADGVEALVVERATPAHVIGTWIAGRPVYARGTWPGVDEAAERRAYEAACARAAAVRASF
jgi:cytosine/adenosine deaminase-related metal-dependent hydrolase